MHMAKLFDPLTPPTLITLMTAASQIRNNKKKLPRVTRASPQGDNTAATATIPKVALIGLGCYNRTLDNMIEVAIRIKK